MTSVKRNLMKVIDMPDENETMNNQSTEDTIKAYFWRYNSNVDS